MKTLIVLIVTTHIGLLTAYAESTYQAPKLQLAPLEAITNSKVKKSKWDNEHYKVEGITENDREIASDKEEEIEQTRGPSSKTKKREPSSKAGKKKYRPKKWEFKTKF